MLIFNIYKLHVINNFIKTNYYYYKEDMEKTDLKLIVKLKYNLFLFFKNRDKSSLFFLCDILLFCSVFVVFFLCGLSCVLR